MKSFRNKFVPLVELMLLKNKMGMRGRFVTINQHSQITSAISITLYYRMRTLWVVDRSLLAYQGSSFP